MRTAQVFLRYVDWIGQGDTTRAEAAHHFSVSKSTATYHLERAVSEGYLERYYAWGAANQTGWAYRIAGTQLEYDNLEAVRAEMEQERELDRIENEYLLGSEMWTAFAPQQEG